MWLVKFRDICEGSMEGLSRKDWFEDVGALYGPFDTIGEAEQFLQDTMRESIRVEFPEGELILSDYKGLMALSIIEHGEVVNQGQIFYPRKVEK